VEAALLSPKVPKAVKSKLLTDAVAGAPGDFIHFLAAVVKRGRQRLLPVMATEFHALNDVRLNRVRAGVILAREPDEPLKNLIKRTLEERFGNNETAAAAVFGNIRALRGVTALLSLDTDQLNGIFADTAGALGTLRGA